MARLTKLESEGKLWTAEISGLEDINVYNTDLRTGQFFKLLGEDPSLLEKLIVAHLLKKLLACLGTDKFHHRVQKSAQGRCVTHCNTLFLTVRGS
jgi:hypothetical protein